MADWDGDGNEDIFLSQNFFALRPELPRFDAGRGLLLRGNGTGALDPVPGQLSGITIYGEQRGAAVGDFNADGRPDLVVTQNGAATRLYRNRHAQPGLRVRLQGPPNNPNAIGAVIRLQFGQRLGPAREIHSGSGYWSLDSAVQIMARPEPTSSVWVRWPGGTERSSTVGPRVARSRAGTVTPIRIGPKPVRSEAQFTPRSPDGNQKKSTWPRFSLATRPRFRYEQPHNPTYERL